MAWALLNGAKREADAAPHRAAQVRQRRLGGELATRATCLALALWRLAGAGRPLRHSTSALSELSTLPLRPAGLAPCSGSGAAGHWHWRRLARRLAGWGWSWSRRAQERRSGHWGSGRRTPADVDAPNYATERANILQRCPASVLVCSLHSCAASCLVCSNRAGPHAVTAGISVQKNGGLGGPAPRAAEQGACCIAAGSIGSLVPGEKQLRRADAQSSAGELQPVDACLGGGARRVRVDQLEVLTPAHGCARGRRREKE
jgi:hypothetical protein